MMKEQWSKLSIRQIEEKLKTNAASGLSRKAARSRVNKNAGDVFITPHKSPLRIFGDLISDFSWLLLFFCAIISLFFDNYGSGFVVVALLFGNLIVSFLFHYNSVRTTEQLSSYFYPKVRLIRKGKLFYDDARHVVPGDVLLIEAGDILCCDARLIHSDELVVNMRLDQKNYVQLEKYAEGFISSQINHPKDTVNMIHAGSIVKKGSARAIVTAVGKYTYLGALTGGIQRPSVPMLPKSIQNLRGKCAKWNTGLLLAVLPLCIFSLLIGHFFGGTILLSTAFLTYMSVVATGVSHMICTVAVFFYTKQCHRLLSASHPSVLQSAETMDRLANVDYIFVRDGASLSDGISHFSTVWDIDGVIYPQPTSAQRIHALSEIIALYYMASSESLSTGLNHSSQYEKGLSEFLQLYSVDKEALRIRCKLVSYLSANLTTEEEKFCIEERGKKIWFSVSTSPDTLHSCTTAVRSGMTQHMNDESRNSLIIHCKKMISSRHIPLIFKKISDNGIDGENSCFLGILFLKEGIDERAKAHIHKLEELGCHVISFSDATQIPQLPCLTPPNRCVSKSALLSHNLPLTYQFGSFGHYTDFQNEDIQILIQYVHSQKKRVALLSFNEQPKELHRSADLTISCAPVQIEEYKSGAMEIVDLGTSGHPHSTTCTQTAKEQASMLIPRPSEGKGGLTSIIHAILLARKVIGSLNDFLTYMVSAQIIRIVLAVIPMMLGKTIIDARHIIFCSCLMDCVAFFVFAQRIRERHKVRRQSVHIQRDHASVHLVINCMVCALLALMIPYVMELFSIFGPFLYQTEYLFISMLLLHLTVLVLVLYPSFRQFKTLYKNYLLLIELFFLIIFILLCFTAVRIGGLFAMEKCPLAYAIATFIPSIVLLLVTCLQRMRPHKQKTE